MHTFEQRLPAEWEPQSAVQLTFPHEGTDWADVLDEVMPCFIEIAETVSRYQKVLVVCRDLLHTQHLLRHASQENLLLAVAATDDTWARDHGGITVFKNGEPLILDFIFNGWGLKFPAERDNALTRHLYTMNIFQAPLQSVDLVLEGGGIESNGHGILMTTAECMLSPKRNPHVSKADIEAQLSALFGAQQILWLHQGYLAGDDTDSHIDTLARFCHANTIAYVKCDDPEDEHFPALARMEAELQAARNLEGEAFDLVPLPWPQARFAPDGHRLPATYANFLLINGAVLVPLYRVPQDEQALLLFKNIFPDLDVIGIDCSVLILQHGSLHCVTMQYPVGVV